MNSAINHTHTYEKWPDSQLEEVVSCPVCNSRNNIIFESGLKDLMSKPPTGLWYLRECVDCHVKYLSPRPDQQSIKKAYGQYYTHTSEKDDLVHSALRAMKESFSRRYYLSLSGRGGAFDRFVYLASRVIFPVSFYLEAKSRHIFSINKQPGRLLDVGCGNGEFLKLADNYGWSVVGVDFDEHAVAEAKLSGLDVRVGGIEAVNAGDKFDYITLSHVIEHVYDPVNLIQSCFALLNHGGTLWIETPNGQSFGYDMYKSNWRGLEPPRHLVIFCGSVLNRLLLDAGFISVEQKLHALSGVYMCLASERLLNISSSCDSAFICGFWKLRELYRMVFLEIMQLLVKHKREYLTFMAKK